MRSVNYKEKDFDQIFKEMLQDAYQYELISSDEHFLDYINNRQDIENMYILFLSVYAMQTSEFYEDATRIYNSNDLDKAVGKDLDILGAKVGIPRPPARKSSVTLHFSAETVTDVDIRIPRGTIVSDGNGNSYYTVENAVIIRGTSSVNVGALSVDGGYNSHVGRNTLTFIERTNNNSLNNISVTNYKGSSGGRSEYSDDEYRELIRNWTYSHIKGTKEAYELFFSYYDGVESYRLVPKWDGAGTLKVIIDPSDDWIINDVSEKLLQNVELFDDDVFVTGANKKVIDINAEANVSIDNIEEYSDTEKQILKQKIINAIKVYIDGGYRNNGEYYTGLLIGEDFIPLQCAVFILQEVPQLKSIDFGNTIKNFDKVIYANEFSPVSYTDLYGEIQKHPSPSIDAFNNKLIGDFGDTCQSDVIYITNQTTFESDNNGYRVEFMQNGESVFKSEESHFVIDSDVDIYGSVIKLTAIKDNASISKITINGIDETISEYNAHIKIDDESICVCRDVVVNIE